LIAELDKQLAPLSPLNASSPGPAGWPVVHDRLPAAAICGTQSSVAMI
jgi:hypothetical protein